MDLDTALRQTGGATSCPAAIIIRRDSVLVGLRDYTPDKYKQISVWTIPGGRCDVGETLQETVRREVYEETGIKDLTIVGYCGEVPGAKEGDVVHMFQCTSAQEPILMEPEKFSEWKWVSVDDIPENFINERVRAVIKNLMR